MKDVLNLYQKCFNSIVEYHSSKEFFDELKTAKSEFLNNWIKEGENIGLYNQKMNQFLDWYVYERPLNRIKKIPLENYLDVKKDLDESSKSMFDSMKVSIRSLFLFKKVKNDHIYLYDLINKSKYQVFDNLNLKIILTDYSIIDARIIETKWITFFSNGYCVHDSMTYSYINYKIKIIKKSKINEEEKLRLYKQLFADLLLKYDLSVVYKHVDIKQIYSDNPIVKFATE